jgi:hypothetical protein
MSQGQQTVTASIWKDPTIYIPSSFNYRILNLHAVSLRKDDADA